METRRIRWVAGAIALSLLAISSFAMNATDAVEAALRAYTAGEYPKAVEILQAASAKESNNSDLFLLLSKSFYELKEFEKATESAEKVIAIDPRSSQGHEWLGRSYGERADRAGWFAAISFAKKARKEFVTAVELDERNFSAMQALIEFDCSAPGIVGGGDDKAAKEIERIAALDVAEGHYARGNCRRQKKEFEEADAEFTKALQSAPKSVDLVYDIGDYAMKRDQTDRLANVVEVGERLNPNDPRGPFYRAVLDILRGERLAGAEKAIRDYLERAPKKNTYPSAAMSHYWLGRLREREAQRNQAQAEYETALKLEPKNRYAGDALKRVKKQ
ncbi:MAG TPA: tetratricopeptide repeat protein [Candidatus Acidoferrum sp.]|nr:tetratricopeptide repeat protein [Candidatus Acidoferrum sp.]